MLLLHEHEFSDLVKVTWIDYLKREDLLRYAAEFGFDESGTVDELKRFASFIQVYSGREDLKDRFTELTLRHARPAVTLEPAMPREDTETPLPRRHGIIFRKTRKRQ
ncbi:unnamed protein product [Ceratitis capitata]|uniref:(Mediterranean fruit fly) hypothetical protein n=1 Tax=Ceratitis capitata TaxID=7213 RepID=A0A811TZC9_CERCA|nr:unnamed protein product [Ceratitis capitata]